MLKSLKSFARAAALALVAFAAPASAQESKTHGAWEVRCKGKACYMAQIASDAKGKPVMSLALKKLAKPVTEGKNTFVAAAEFRTKLGVFLPQGVTFAIDGGKKRRIPFERCLPEGCAALPLIQKGLVDELKSGGKVIMTVYANPKTPITVSVSLSGFTAAFDSMK